MNFLDVFTGIGGLSLGLERAGMRPVGFCEIDPFCRRVLAKHWPDVPCFVDIRELDADGLGRLGPIHLLSGGYPCQPFSQAGKRQGKADDRYLWPEMRRLVASLRPAWFVGENVIGHIAVGLDEVLTDLEGIGYAARPFVLPAAAVDAWHVRARVWIIGRYVADPGADLRDDQQRAAGGRDELPDGGDAVAVHHGPPQSVADASGAGLEERPGEKDEPRAIRHQGDATAACRWWDPEPNVCRVAHGVPHRVDRLRALGNAVVPQLAEAIGRAILLTATSGAIARSGESRS